MLLPGEFGGVLLDSQGSLPPLGGCERLALPLTLRRLQSAQATKVANYLATYSWTEQLLVQALDFPNWTHTKFPFCGGVVTATKTGTSHYPQREHVV